MSCDNQIVSKSIPTLQKNRSVCNEDFDFPTRKRSAPVFVKRHSEPFLKTENPFGWQATHRKISRSNSERSMSAGKRGDPTILGKADEVTNNQPAPLLDTKSVEEEHSDREKQKLLKKTILNGLAGAKGDPIYQEHPFSPASGRTVQSHVSDPFCYATGLEPVQEFLGNLSINSESSYLSSYNSLEDKAKILA